MMKILALSVLAFLMLSVAAWAETVVKIWRVGSIVVIEYVEENGDRIIHARSFEEDGDTGKDERVGAEQKPNSYHRINSEFPTVNAASDDRSFYNELKAQRLSFDQSQTVKTATAILESFMDSPGWQSKDSYWDLESNGAIFIGGLCNFDGMADPIILWIDHIARQPFVNTIGVEIDYLASYLIERGTEDEVRSGINLLESLISREVIKKSRYQIVRGLTNLRDYATILGWQGYDD